MGGTRRIRTDARVIAATNVDLPARIADGSFRADLYTLRDTAGDGLAWIFTVQPGTASLSGQLSNGAPLRPRQVSVEASLFIQIGLEP